ncbi:MAG: hypothetical protein H0W67_04320 [Gemmatimonadales bacterium]|nr:hypothetical protein [Gemmatimonadales bacterium]
MMLAQPFFALMNVCTRLGARELSWAEIAAVRLTYLAAIPVFGERRTAWQLAGSGLVIVAGILVTAGGRVRTAAPGRL